MRRGADSQCVAQEPTEEPCIIISLSLSLYIYILNYNIIYYINLYNIIKYYNMGARGAVDRELGIFFLYRVLGRGRSSAWLGSWEVRRLGGWEAGRLGGWGAGVCVCGFLWHFDGFD